MSCSLSFCLFTSILFQLSVWPWLIWWVHPNNIWRLWLWMAVLRRTAVFPVCPWITVIVTQALKCMCVLICALAPQPALSFVCVCVCTAFNHNAYLGLTPRNADSGCDHCRLAEILTANSLLLFNTTNSLSLGKYTFLRSKHYIKYSNVFLLWQIYAVGLKSVCTLFDT